MTRDEKVLLHRGCRENADEVDALRAKVAELEHELQWMRMIRGDLIDRIARLYEAALPPREDDEDDGVACGSTGSCEADPLWDDLTDIRDYPEDEAPTKIDNCRCRR